MAAKRWKEEMDKAESIVDGMHPKPAGLEDEELEIRREKFSASSLGNLTYERQGGTFRFIMNQVDNMSTRNVREIKVDQHTRLANRYDADTWSIGEHGINFQKRATLETIASCFDTEIKLRSVSSSSTYERTESNHLPGEQQSWPLIRSRTTLNLQVRTTGI